MSNRKKPKQGQQKKNRKPEAVDFDAIRAKRQRVQNDVPPITIGGKDYSLPNRFPLAVTEYFAEGSKRDEEGNVVALLADMQALLKVLFGEKQWEQISYAIDITEVPALFNTVFDTYGESLGKPSNSGQS